MYGCERGCLQLLSAACGLSLQVSPQTLIFKYRVTHDLYCAACFQSKLLAQCVQSAVPCLPRRLFALAWSLSDMCSLLSPTEQRLLR